MKLILRALREATNKKKEKYENNVLFLYTYKTMRILERVQAFLPLLTIN